MVKCFVFVLLVQRYWFGDFIILGIVKIKFGQVVFYFVVFDKFGDGFQVGGVVDLVIGVYDFYINWVSQQILYEVVINFEIVDWQGFEVGKGIYFGFKVIQGELKVFIMCLFDEVNGVVQVCDC